MSIALKNQSELTSDQWSAREDLLYRFEQAWRRGARPVLEESLPREEHQRHAVLLEMVQTDLEYRLKDGEPARVEDYLDRFPELRSDPAAELELINAELNWRRRHEPGPVMAEFLERFPEFRSALITSPLTRRPAVSAAPAVSAQAKDRQRVGKYKLIGIAGRGAFGVVYRAHDTELDRTVALKILKIGPLESPEEMDRLLREARSAGRLSHPNIVRVHDAGRAGDTCFMVCEFVPGSTLAHRIASGPIRVREAASIVAQVAQALHHAHSEGVIHRDVKPSNILLGQDGTPRLTDFGLAHRDGGETTLTRAGQILGTPAYMPPEQARGDGHHVDGRSDLYCLGVILYEMLTGELPFRGNTEMVLRQVLQEEPQPPRRLNNLIPRDLETICLKCLEKQPIRRYSTAGALAGDLRRFMNREPIQARPVGQVERLLKWSRRNPWLAAFLTALLLGVIVSTLQTIRARGAERAATLSADHARRSEAEAQATLDFFRDKVLAAARPKDEERGLGIEATIRAAIDAAEPEIAKSFVDQPLVAASIRETLGTTYRCLGEPALAIPQHEKALRLRRQALGPDHRLTLITMNNLALAYQNTGRLADALTLQGEELQRSRKTGGSDHQGILTSMNNLARIYRDLGRIDEALDLNEKVLKQARITLGDNHPDTLIYMNNLATTYRVAMRHAEALPLHEEALRRSKAALGPDHPHTLICMFNLSVACRLLGRVDDALILAEEELSRTRRIMGALHPSTFLSISNVASVHRDSGRLTDALPLYAEALKGQQDRLGPDHPQTLATMNELAMAHLGAGHIDDAAPLLENRLEWSKAKFGLDHPDTLVAMANLARARLVSRPAEAERLLRQVLAIREKKNPDDWRTFQTRSMLGGSLLHQQRYAEAEPLLVQGYEGMMAREAKIPHLLKKRQAEAAEWLNQLHDARGKKAESAAWR